MDIWEYSFNLAEKYTKLNVKKAVIKNYKFIYDSCRIRLNHLFEGKEIIPNTVELDMFFNKNAVPTTYPTFEQLKKFNVPNLYLNQPRPIETFPVDYKSSYIALSGEKEDKETLPARIIHSKKELIRLILELYYDKEEIERYKVAWLLNSKFNFDFNDDLSKIKENIISIQNLDDKQDENLLTLKIFLRNSLQTREDLLKHKIIRIPIVPVLNTNNNDLNYLKSLIFAFNQKGLAFDFNKSAIKDILNITTDNAAQNLIDKIINEVDDKYEFLTLNLDTEKPLIVLYQISDIEGVNLDFDNQFFYVPFLSHLFKKNYINMAENLIFSIILENNILKGNFQASTAWFVKVLNQTKRQIQEMDISVKGYHSFR